MRYMLAAYRAGFSAKWMTLSKQFVVLSPALYRARAIACNNIYRPHGETDGDRLGRQAIDTGSIAIAVPLRAIDANCRCS